MVTLLNRQRQPPRPVRPHDLELAEPVVLAQNSAVAIQFTVVTDPASCQGCLTFLLSSRIFILTKLENFFSSVLEIFSHF